ncbi:MAG: MBL fold metallo-hydrolase [Hyphomicrobiaceae bacterium]
MATPLTITGFSTARFATWYFLDELRILFDVGDGAAAQLGSKCNKVRHVFLSHADRDHLGGLVQFYQLAAHPPNPPTFYYPKDSGSFPALKDFLERFDPGLAKCAWVPVEGGTNIEIAKNYVVEVGENDHIQRPTGGHPDQVKSLDFALIERRRKLRAEFKGSPGREIARLRTEHGENHVTERTDRRLFGFSGDTPQFDIARWNGIEVLAHEATFIAPDEADRGHAELGAVLRAASQLDLKALVLGHFSSRYSTDMILTAIVAEAERLAIRFPVFAVVPGEVARDVLAREPIWPGA